MLRSLALYPVRLCFLLVVIGTLSTGLEDVRRADPASAGPGDPGYIDASHVGRYPDGYPDRVAHDKVVFTTDLAASLLIQATGAPTGSRWTWRYDFPGPDNLNVGCWYKLASASDPQNPSGVTAYIHNCTPTGVVKVFITFPGGCPCDLGYFFGPTLNVRRLAQYFPGEWQGTVDYTDPLGVTTPAVAQDVIKVIRSPLVLITHGWESDCNAMDGLVSSLALALAIDPFRVRCFPYDSRSGVASAGCEMRTYIESFRQTDFRQTEIDIVGHSMGGLVARHYAEHCRQPGDPTVGSISMLATPNEGVYIANIVRNLCPSKARIVPFSSQDLTCLIADWATSSLFDIDLHAKAIDDLSLRSDLLKLLNDHFVLPASPIYRAHVGRTDTDQGVLTSAYRENDCFVTEFSVDGPGGLSSVFGDDNGMHRYFNLSHTAGFGDCSDPTIYDHPSVIANLLPDIEGLLFEGPDGPDFAGPDAAVAQSISYSTIDAVTPNEQKAHTITVPAGTTAASFMLYWLTSDDSPQISFELRRPGGAVVAATDSDVQSELGLQGASALYVNAKGYLIDAPAAGPWEIRVTGTTVAVEGQAYMVALVPETTVTLEAEVTSDRVVSGQSVLLTVGMFEGTSLVAPNTITAMLFAADNTSTPISLHDDGLNGDVAAGDLEYSAGITTGVTCGTSRILVSATASTSEGTVTREAYTSVDGTVGGDALRDPCDADEDNDGVSDYDEIFLYETDPLDPDPDNDDDGLQDDEEPAWGTDPDDADTDGDGFNDLPPSSHAGPANSMFSRDNCPVIGNSSQPNSDGNFISNSPFYAVDDKTTVMSDAFGDACDADNDNDGLANTDEAVGCDGSGPLSPTNPDTDGDRMLDGVECALGTNPGSAASKLTAAQCAAQLGVTTGIDTDGDRLRDHIELCGYGSNPNSSDSDGDAAGDGARDGCEAASLNGDRVVNSGDQLLFAGELQRVLAGGTPLANFDINKDGSLNSGDQLLMAQLITPLGQCP